MIKPQRKVLVLSFIVSSKSFELFNNVIKYFSCEKCNILAIFSLWLECDDQHVRGVVCGFGCLIASISHFRLLLEALGW